MNVPNHSQAARISNDIRRIQHWQANQTTPWSEVYSSWTGNSYGGQVQTDLGGDVSYSLWHWDTEIARITFRQDEITRVAFNARYISVTTRGFQRRITDGLQRAGFDTNLIEHELALPTHSRGLVEYLTDRHGRTL